jgi:hypothetical protein
LANTFFFILLQLCSVHVEHAVYDDDIEVKVIAAVTKYATYRPIYIHGEEIRSVAEKSFDCSFIFDGGLTNREDIQLGGGCVVVLKNAWEELVPKVLSIWG